MKLLIIFHLVWLSFNCLALGQHDLNRLRQGQTIIKEKQIRNRPWPEYTASKLLQTSPELAAAIFSNYTEQIKYIPNLINASELASPSPTNTHVRYEMKMPWPFANAIYTTGNILKKMSNGSYKISWYLVESSECDDTSGEVSFIPYENKTLVIYKSLIHPKSAFAPVLKPFVKDDLLNTFNSLTSFLESASPESKIAQNSLNILRLRLAKEMSEK